MEMLIVVTIIAILAAIVIPRFLTSSKAAKDSAYNAEKQTINSQIELFYFLHGEYPSAMTNEGWTISGVVDYKEFWPEGVPTADVFSRAWEIDSNTGRVKSQ